MEKKYFRIYLIKYAGIALLLTTLFSCNARFKKYIIPEKKFVEVLTDLHIAEGIGLETQSDIITDYAIDSASLYGSIFRKHDITQAMFDSTLLYYCQRPAKFQKLYNSVTGRIKRMEEDLSKEWEAQLKLIEEVIWQNDTVYKFPPLAGDRIEINMPIYVPGIYTVSATVKIMPDDGTLDPRMNVYFYSDDSTMAGKRIPFETIRYLHRGSEEKIYKAGKQLDGTSYTHIRGVIVDYSNPDSMFKRNMTVSQIKVTRRNN